MIISGGYLRFSSGIKHLRSSWSNIVTESFITNLLRNSLAHSDWNLLMHSVALLTRHLPALLQRLVLADLIWNISAHLSRHVSATLLRHLVTHGVGHLPLLGLGHVPALVVGVLLAGAGDGDPDLVVPLPLPLVLAVILVEGGADCLGVGFILRLVLLHAHLLVHCPALLLIHNTALKMYFK